MGAIGAKRTGIALTEKQKIDWLRLIRSDNIGPATFRDLINHCGSAEIALTMLPELSVRGGATRPLKIASRDEALREFEAAQRFGARFVGIGEPDYPAALKHVDGAPPLLAIKGDLAIVDRPALGIVGSRNASLNGLKFTGQLARDCGRAGYAIVSGLARGIDTAAHRATLETGTIAAMAGGLDRPYPPENAQLLEAIWNGGGIAVSEMPFGWEPRARDFPRRNRLIAGIGLGLAVVEAAQRSGSLITARLAGEFGRLVFAVPGSPLDPRSEGTNGLIKEGAALITGADDVLEALSPLWQNDLFPHRQAEEAEPRPERNLAETIPEDAERDRVMDLLGPSPVDVDDLIHHSGLSPAAVYLLLLELDIAGRLQRHRNGSISLAMPD